MNFELYGAEHMAYIYAMALFWIMVPLLSSRFLSYESQRFVAILLVIAIIGIEIIDHDNDFYHMAFSSARDYRRYWKDFNLHVNFNKRFQNFNLSSNLVFTRSLNYQWELDDSYGSFYTPGRDVNNIHINFKITYFTDF